MLGGVRKIGMVQRYSNGLGVILTRRGPCAGLCGRSLHLFAGFCDAVIFLFGKRGSFWTSTGGPGADVMLHQLAQLVVLRGHPRHVQAAVAPLVRVGRLQPPPVAGRRAPLWGSVYKCCACVL